MRPGVPLCSACVLALLSFPLTAHAQGAADASSVVRAPSVASAATSTPDPSTPDPSTPDPSTADIETRSARMGRTLEHLASAHRWSALKTSSHLVVGAAFVGLAGYFAFSKNLAQGTGSSRGAAVILSMMTGGAYLGRGVYALSGPVTTHEARLTRFRERARRGPLTAADLAPFEAELALEAELGRNARRWEAASSLGIAVGGASLFAFGATSELRHSAREIVYIEGGVMLLSGAGLGIYSLLTESASEAEWRKYRAGDSSSTAFSKRWQLAPVVSTRLAALSLSGEF